MHSDQLLKYLGDRNNFGKAHSKNLSHGLQNRVFVPLRGATPRWLGQPTTSSEARG